LRRSAATGGVDREQYRPCDAASSDADQNDEFEEAQKKVAIERLVAKDELVI
jgi:hypothetical protein